MRMTGRVAALIAMLAAVPATGKNVPRVAKPPQPRNLGRWFGADNYPPSAIRAGEQGRVVAIVSIDATGRPTACRIDISTGSSALDEKTCDIVLTSGEFDPARDPRGRAIASEMPMPVRWVLPDAGDPRLRSGPNDFTMIQTIAADDTIEACEIIVDGKPQATEGAPCGAPGFDPAGMRATLKVVGRFRLRSDSLVRHGDTPPPLPKAPAAGRVLSFREARQDVDAEGVATNCTMAVGGEWAEQMKSHHEPTICETHQLFYPVPGPNGVPKPVQVLLATWLTLLPPEP